MKKILPILFLLFACGAHAQPFTNWTTKHPPFTGTTVPADVFNGTSHGNYKLDMTDFVTKADSTLYLTKASYKKSMDSLAVIIVGIDSSAFKLNISDTAAMLSPYARAANVWTKTQGDARYLQSFTESDPTVSSAIKAITSTQIGQWNTAYGWGNHAGLYRPLSYVPAWNEVVNKPITLSGYGISDAYPLSGNPSGFLTTVPAQSFSSLTGKPTTLSGYGITDAATASHTHAFSSLTSTPTTLAGYGITTVSANDLTASASTAPTLFFGSSAQISRRGTGILSLGNGTRDDASGTLVLGTLTASGTVTGSNIDQTFTSAEKTKLSGIATGATANSSDATLLNRANHTGTQLAATISNFQATVSANTDVSANATAIAALPTASSTTTFINKTISGTSNTFSNIPFSAVIGQVLNAKDYGAVGDGTTNDVVAIQNAMNASASTGKPLYIPAGNYLLYVPGYVAGNSYTNLYIRPGTVMFGDGDKTNLIRYSTHIDGYVMGIDQTTHNAASLSSRNYTIRNMKFTGITGRGYETPGTTNYDGGLFIVGSQSNPSNKVIIEGVTMTTFNKECIAVWFANESIIKSNRVYNCNHDAYNPQTVSRLIMTGNFADGANFGCEFIGDRIGATLNYALIEGNQFVNTYEYGIAIEAADFCQISGNTFSHYGGSTTVTSQAIGIFVSPVIDTIGTLLISDNIVTGFINGGIATDDNSINYITSHLIIKNNIVRNTGVNPIIIRGSSTAKFPEVEVVGNNLSNWNRIDNGNGYIYSAIALYNINNASISKNRIFNELVYPGEAYGLRNDPLYLSNSTNIRFFDNDLTGKPSLYSSTLTIRLNGTNTYSEWNNTNLDGAGTVPYERLTTTQRTGISSPKEGRVVYDITTHILYIYNGSGWQAAF